MGRPTVRDIAREAGVSLATVDRVLNGRSGVRQKTIGRVQEAIRNLGYVRDTHAANLARQREYRFCFVLPEGADQFVETVRSALLNVRRGQLFDRMVLRTLDVPAQDAHGIVRALDALEPGSFDGIALMVPETPQVRDSVARIRRAGVPVVAFVSDLPGSARDHFVGINGVAAGRTAGFLIGRFAGESRGQIIVVSNSLQSHASIDRRLGFDAIIREEFSGLRPLPTLETHNDPERTEQTLARAIDAYPGIIGVYSMVGGDKSVLEALRRFGRLKDLIVIVHELTPAARSALIDREVDAVINQNVGHLVRSSLRVLRALVDGAPIYMDQERPRIEIVTRENIPDEG